MCPLWPLHLIVMYAVVLFPLWLATCSAANYAANKLPFTFNPESVLVQLENTQEITVNATFDYCSDDQQYTIVGDQTSKKIISLGVETVSFHENGTECLGYFNLTGENLGKSFLQLKSESGILSDKLNVTVIREERVIDSVFTYSVIILVSIIYINFGCILDWPVLKQTLKRPIGPAIGFGCQFVIMPLLSYGLGKWIFPDSPEMQLGLFFTGLSPAGGASNIWSVALDANVNLSVTMTTISTIAAFAMFPFWLFTLGDQIFAQADMATPYEKIASYVISLVIPLGIGLLSQKYLPRFAKLMVRILKPFSIFLILFIVIFACVTNTYLFDLFTWQIAVAGIGLPWLGYFGGFLVAMALKQPMKDVLAIAVETGVQNTGIAIFMLRLTLDQPAGDITTVLPVSVSIMTPIPLLLLFIYIRLRNRNSKKEDIHKQNMLENGMEKDPDLALNGNYIRQP